jgi:arginine repressor
LGTVAGDDTIIIILAEGVSHEEAYTALSKYIPALRAQ